MINKNLETTKRVSYLAAVLIITVNIFALIGILWINPNFIISGTYIKIIITSIALVVLSILIAGFASFMCEEKLKKDKLIN
jgi:polyferredoxin